MKSLFTYGIQNTKQMFVRHRTDSCDSGIAYCLLPAVFFLLSVLTTTAWSQNVAINTSGTAANLSAGLDISFTNKGFLAPRLTLAQRTTAGTALVDGSGLLPAAAQGLLVYQTDGTQGFYYNTSSTTTPAWAYFSTANTWSSLGNAATVDGTHFLGTTDNVPLNFKVNNQKAGRLTSGGEVFLGYQAGNNNSAVYNTGIGYQALQSNTTGDNNTAIGNGALRANTSGNYNTAVGWEALRYNTMGNNNTANGYEALKLYTTGDANTAIGYYSLRGSVWGTASYNTADGQYALSYNKDGNYNTAAGVMALYLNTSGSYNTAVGVMALYSNKSGNENTAGGCNSLYSNTTGSRNTGIGFNSLYANVTGTDNVAIGHSSLRTSTVSDNIAVGTNALYSNTTASKNIAIGIKALYTQSYNNGGASWDSENIGIGYEALYLNQPTSTANGSMNTAVGNYSMRANTTGYKNTAIGYNSMLNNTTGYLNVAVGHEALRANIGGYQNTGIGYKALDLNTNGYDNTVAGHLALTTNGTGDENTALGRSALNANSSGIQNTAAGAFAVAGNTLGNGNTGAGYQAINNITDGDYNIGLGYMVDADATGRNGCIVIGGNGNLATTADSEVRIGNASMTSIGGQVAWSTLSDERIKDNVQEDVKGMDFIMKLRPVTYNYNVDKSNRLQGIEDTSTWVSKYDIEKMRFSGFLAQEVDKAAREAGFNFGGVDTPGNGTGLWGIRYEELTVPQVKAVQEQQGIIERLKSKNNTQKAELQSILTEIEKLETIAAKLIQADSAASQERK